VAVDATNVCCGYLDGKGRFGVQGGGGGDGGGVSYLKCVIC